jgi:hypothetical protein
MRAADVQYYSMCVKNEMEDDRAAAELPRHPNDCASAMQPIPMAHWLLQVTAKLVPLRRRQAQSQTVHSGSASDGGLLTHLLSLEHRS